MSFKRTIAGLVCVALAALAVDGTAVAAQAKPATASAAAAMTRAAGGTAAASSPDISPAAERVRYVGLFDSYSCSLGRACLAVWDPNVVQFKVFDLFRCGTYNLRFWHDRGSMKNNQTGNAAVRLLDANGGLIGSPYPPAGPDGYYQIDDWDPVWKVKPC